MDPSGLRSIPQAGIDVAAYFLRAGRGIRVDCGPDLAFFEGGCCAEGLRLPWSCCTDAGPSFLIVACWLTSSKNNGKHKGK